MVMMVPKQCEHAVENAKMLSFMLCAIAKLMI